MAYEVMIKLNTILGVNLQGPSQSFSLVTSSCSKKTLGFQSILDFGILEEGYQTVMIKF
jgi:hypothetical protein